MKEGKYIKLYDEAIQHLGLTNAVVYCFLLGLGDYKPSIQNIAERCGISLRTTKVVISFLKDCGAITYNEGKGTNNVYQCIEVQKLHLCKKGKNCTTRSAKTTLQKGKNCTTESAETALYNNNNNNLLNNKGNNATKNSDLLLSKFCEVYEQRFSTPYIPEWSITNDRIELEGKLRIMLEKDKYNGDIGEYYQSFFKRCLDVADKYELEHFTIPHITKNFNSYIIKIRNGNKTTNPTNPNASFSEDYKRRLAQRLYD